MHETTCFSLKYCLIIMLDLRLKSNNILICWCFCCFLLITESHLISIIGDLKTITYTQRKAVIVIEGSLKVTAWQKVENCCKKNQLKYS